MQNLKLKMDTNLKAINEMQQVFERWRLIDGYDNYSVSTFGRVKNIDTGIMMKNRIGANGYYKVNLCKNGKKKTITVHRLVASAFIANPNKKPYVDHKNNDKFNNNITNLRWVTNEENQQNRTLNENNTSGVKGVIFHKKAKKWMAYIRIDKILIHLGYFELLEDAKKARIERANQAFGVYTNACEK
jgi:hypothetical protein